jgi:hypothetical protein
MANLTDAELAEIAQHAQYDLQGPTADRVTRELIDVRARLRRWVESCPKCQGGGTYWNGLLGRTRPCPDCGEDRMALGIPARAGGEA